MSAVGNETLSSSAAQQAMKLTVFLVIRVAMMLVCYTNTDMYV